MRRSNHHPQKSTSSIDAAVMNGLDPFNSRYPIPKGAMANGVHSQRSSMNTFDFYEGPQYQPSQPRGPPAGQRYPSMKGQPHSQHRVSSGQFRPSSRNSNVYVGHTSGQSQPHFQQNFSSPNRFSSRNQRGQFTQGSSRSLSQYRGMHAPHGSVGSMNRLSMNSAIGYGTSSMGGRPMSSNGVSNMVSSNSSGQIRPHAPVPRRVGTGYSSQKIPPSLQVISRGNSPKIDLTCNSTNTNGASHRRHPSETEAFQSYINYHQQLQVQQQQEQQANDYKMRNRPTNINSYLIKVIVSPRDFKILEPNAAIVNSQSNSNEEKKRTSSLGSTTSTGILLQQIEARIKNPSSAATGDCPPKVENIVTYLETVQYHIRNKVDSRFWPYFAGSSSSGSISCSFVEPPTGNKPVVASTSATRLNPSQLWFESRKVCKNLGWDEEDIVALLYLSVSEIGSQNRPPIEVMIIVHAGNESENMFLNSISRGGSRTSERTRASSAPRAPSVPVSLILDENGESISNKSTTTVNRIDDVNSVIEEIGLKSRTGSISGNSMFGSQSVMSRSRASQNLDRVLQDYLETEKKLTSTSIFNGTTISKTEFSTCSEDDADRLYDQSLKEFQAYMNIAPPVPEKDQGYISTVLNKARQLRRNISIRSNKFSSSIKGESQSNFQSSNESLSNNPNNNSAESVPGTHETNPTDINDCFHPNTSFSFIPGNQSIIENSQVKPLPPCPLPVKSDTIVTVKPVRRKGFRGWLSQIFHRKSTSFSTDSITVATTADAANAAAANTAIAGFANSNRVNSTDTRGPVPVASVAAPFPNAPVIPRTELKRSRMQSDGKPSRHGSALSRVTSHAFSGSSHSLNSSIADKYLLTKLDVIDSGFMKKYHNARNNSSTSLQRSNSHLSTLDFRRDSVMTPRSVPPPPKIPYRSMYQPRPNTAGAIPDHPRNMNMGGVEMGRRFSADNQIPNKRRSYSMVYPAGGLFETQHQTRSQPELHSASLEFCFDPEKDGITLPLNIQKLSVIPGNFSDNSLNLESW